ncbi:MAG: hypothetical protein M3521_12375 [Acidobacteriota bacterium]|nr:hypothetical protein [Acidobacteriota bacterium]
MDFEKILALAVENISEYFYAFWMTLKRPFLRFLPTQELQPVVPNQNLLIDHMQSKEISFKIAPKLVSFALISIFISLSIQSVITNYQDWQRLVISSITVFIFWIVFSCLISLFCKIIRIKNSFIAALSVCIQVLSVSYVVCNLVTLIILVIIKSFTTSTTHALETQSTTLAEMLFFSYYLIYLSLENYRILFQYPFIIYFHLQLLFLSIYLPRAIKVTFNVNNFKTIILYFVLIISVIIPFVVFGISFYKSNSTIISSVR